MNLYKYINNKKHIYNTPFFTPNGTLFSPLFQSFSSQFSEQLLNNTFGISWINRKLEEVDDNEDFLLELLLQIQNNCKHIIIIDTQTGEIISKIPLTKQNLEKTAEELHISGFSAFCFGEIYEDGLMGSEMFETSGSVTYKQNGVRIHKPPFDLTWDCGSHRLTCEFVSRETGEATDRFYGTCNDFNMWFIGKAARGEKFDVVVRQDSEAKPLTYVTTRVGTIMQKHDGSWDKMEYEPLRKINDKCFLLNTLMEDRDGEILRKSSAFGDLLVWKIIA